MKSFTGIVAPGLARAGTLGFPTVNIPLSEPISGVYVGRLMCNAETYPAAVFADSKRKILEAHLIDFSEDLYGKPVEIFLLEKIRDSKMFTDDAALQHAIAEDVMHVRHYFKQA